MSQRTLVGLVSLALALGAVVRGEAIGDVGAELWVNGRSAACSDDYSRLQAGSSDTPWCSLVRAAAAATAGDTVHVQPGRYLGTVRPASSTTFVGEAEGATIDAAGASAAIKLSSVSDVKIQGIAVTGAAVQGIWASGVDRVTFDRLDVNGNGGPGIQVLNSTATTITHSRITGNGGAGVFEGAGTSGGMYVSNEIRSNGLNGEPYNGDGIQIGGVGAYIAGNTIVANGDPGPFEHGIYTGPSARDFVIEGNVVGRNAGSNIKAAGSNGTIRYNRLEEGRLGLVLSDNAAPVVVYYNLIFGQYQHAVFLTVGHTAAQARLWNNTLVVTARNGGSGDASAVFVKSADLLDMRNNVVSYTNPDNAGSAVNVPDAGQVKAFTSDNNWFSSTQANGRHVVWNGARVTLNQWTRNTGQDGATVASAPPLIDADAYVVSTNLGRARGQYLGLVRDYSGIAVPTASAPDIGAHQAA
ncbi:MAG TPA: right-handed parallel beta-helix repeat-containing protein [Acidimicrobiales bacterium]|nr:right-handed parallel beta-helix repeat-containing protein [Acidimicrobiales bacterium]